MGFQWKMRDLAVTKHQLCRSSCHYSSQVATDRRWSKRPPIPARPGRDDGCYPADVSRKKGEHPVNKTRMRRFFFAEGGGVVCLFGGFGDFRIPTQRKSAIFFILSEEKSLNNQEGFKLFIYCSGPTSPWEWGKVSKSFFWRGGNPRNLHSEDGRLDHGSTTKTWMTRWWEDVDIIRMFIVSSCVGLFSSTKTYLQLNPSLSFLRGFCLFLVLRY